MRKTLILFIALVCVLSVTATALAQDDVKKYPSCKYCGMDREKFAHSRMLIEYTDGTVVGTCSIHCAAVDLALNIDKTPKAVLVGDYNTKALIDAEKATWVLGGSKMGVMTRNAKWAFLQKGDAEKFIGQNGGKPATYDDAMKASYEDMYADTKMIRDKTKDENDGAQALARVRDQASSVIASESLRSRLWHEIAAHSRLCPWLSMDEFGL